MTAILIVFKGVICTFCYCYIANIAAKHQLSIKLHSFTLQVYLFLSSAEISMLTSSPRWAISPGSRSEPLLRPACPQEIASLK